jgi:hypothetical protein
MPQLMPHVIFPNINPAEPENPAIANISVNDISESEVPKQEIEISDIFRIHWEKYRKNNPVTRQQEKAVYDIMNCRTGTYGYSINVCDKCAHTKIFPNSCRNRHCPKCQGSKRIIWTEARINDLLPVPYYHVVFTLPDKIFPLCLFNQELIYNLLLSCSAETLKQFGEDPKWLGAIIGFFSILHTWGQLLPMHPHIHVVIPAGGYDEKTWEWVFPKYDKNNFLFPVRALSKVFRGKFIEGIKEAYNKGEINFPGELEKISTEQGFENWLNQMVSTEWIVFSKAPFGGPEDVISYVSRYTHRVAISNSRIISIENGIVRFSFKNYKNKHKVENYKELWEETELPAEEFIRRFLYHILPPYFHRIRHYGFLSNGQKAKRQEIWEMLVLEEELKLPEIKTETYEGMPCPECENGKLIPIVVIDGSGRILKGSFSELSDFKLTVRDRYG